MKKKLSFLLILCLILCCCCITQNYIIRNKIVFENFGLSKNCSLEEGLEATQESERIEILIKVNSSKFEKDYQTGENLSNKQYRDHQNERLEKAKKHFFNNNKNILNKLGLGNYLDVYVSKYSPYIELTFDAKYFNEEYFEILSKISRLLDIEVAYVKEVAGYRKDASFVTNFSMAGAYSLYQNSSAPYTGQEVNVGLLEGGVVDADHVNMMNSNLVVRDVFGYWETETDHATKMATIICGELSASRRCNLFSVELYGNPTSEIEWLMDKNVDIVNMSFGESNPTGNYDSTSAYMDYIAYMYNVVFVAAAGNEGEGTGNVANPGMGYNILTVGSIGSSGSLSSFSSIWDNIGAPKPTLCSYGYANIPNYDITTAGTSVATAFVTSFLAVLMEEHPVLKGNPAAILALTTGAAESLSAYTSTTNSGLNDYVGSGNFRYDYIINNYGNYYATIVNTNNINNVVYSRQIYVNAGDEVKGAIAWTAVSDGTINGIEFCDFDIRLRGPNGVLYAYSIDNTSIVEMTRLREAPLSGYYTFEIVQRTEIVQQYEIIHLMYYTTSND